jgi:Cu-Zn family superoxide dismutase
MPNFRAPHLLLAAAGLVLTLQGCGPKAPAAPLPAPAPFAEAILYDGTGKRVGIATLIPGEGHLSGSVEVTGGLTPGDHGMHIHTIGKCTLPDFASAGGHFNPEGKEHGTQNPRGSHAGDLPMITANAQGAAKTSLMAHTTLDALLDEDGAALVIHAGVDDMKSDPAGNAGGRVMCGVFYRKLP